MAYIINFLAGCEGKLGTIGSMSYTKVFSTGEWWRLLFHMYLHAGVLHMLFNVFALLFVGKVVEKKIGSLPYLLLYHVIAVINAIIICFIFPESISVGASAGIFGMIGIVCVMKWKRDDVYNAIKGCGRALGYVCAPSLMQRVIAKVAEAEREKEAVITKSKGEKEAADNLAKAADVLSNSPGALHLRTLATLNDLSSDQSNTIIFAVPIEVLKAFEGNNIEKGINKIKDITKKKDN